MNFLSIAFLFGVLINISYGLSHNCFPTTTITCTVHLMPGEVAYKLFIDSLNNSERSLFDFLLTGETEQALIDKANKLIKENVSEESKKKFFDTSNIFYKSGSKIEMIPCNNGLCNRFNNVRGRYYYMS